MDLLKKAISSLLSLPIMNPLVQSTAKHLSLVSLYNLRGAEALHPDIRDKVKALITRMAELKKPVYLIEGFRTAARQDELYAEGRSNQGNIVTYAKGGESFHQYGLAADLIFVDYDWSPPNGDWWITLGKEGINLGLDWGGMWEFKDRPHFQAKVDDQALGNLIAFFKK